MKNIALLAGVVLIGLPSIVGSVAAKQKNTFGLSVKDGRLIFATIADYRRAVDQPSEKTKADVTRAIGSLSGFASLEQAQKAAAPRDMRESGIGDDYFASILNADKVVQIGDHIYRIDPAAERVYALPAKYGAEYKDLLGANLRNPHILTFSTGDDVLEKIAAGNGAQKALFCSQSGIGGRHASAIVGNMQAHADFNRYGIYYSLSAMVTPYGSSGFPYKMDFTGGISANQGYIHYKIRCGGTASYAISTSGSWKLTHQKYQSYQGSKNLNEVYFVYRLKNGTTFLTSNIGFRVNK